MIKIMRNRKNIPYKIVVFLSNIGNCKIPAPLWVWVMDEHVFLTACWQTWHSFICSYIRGQGICDACVFVEEHLDNGNLFAFKYVGIVFLHYQNLFLILIVLLVVPKDLSLGTYVVITAGF